MYQDGKLIIAKGQAEVCLLPSMANRHGLIAGATGTGQTVTLKTIAQSFSDAGVPTFLADVKGDVSGVAIAGEASPKLVERLSKLGITDYPFHGCPTQFWDVYGEKGLPVRTTISAMGPVLIGRLLELNEVQQGVLTIVFRVADEKKLLLLDLKDLRTMVSWVGDHAKELSRDYGNIAAASVGAIQRSLLTLEDAGGDIFFGEPALDISDWMTCDADGMGTINVLNCVKLVQSPLLYSTFLLWMLTSVYEELPEAGDLDKPKMVFFFDEAHLLFDDAPKALLDKVVQVVKLIRSKGVGVYFITQNPSDIPDEVLGQLGNRVQHALRAYTPAEQKAIKAAAQAFRENPAFKTEEAITELGTGEALISFLDEKGAPSVVERAMVIAPTCSMGAAPDEVVADVIGNSKLRTKYATPVDRESAYEILAAKSQEAQDKLTEQARLLGLEVPAGDADGNLSGDELKQLEKDIKAKQQADAKAADKAKAAAQKKLAQEQARQERELEKQAEAAYKAEQKRREQEVRAAQKRTEMMQREGMRLARSLAPGIMRGILGMMKR